MHIYLQVISSNLSKQRIQKQIYNLQKGKGHCHFRAWRFNLHVHELVMLAWNVSNTIFFYWVLHGIIIVHFIFRFVSNMFLLFIVVTPSIITTHWSLVYYEISLCHAMPNYYVLFIVKTILHCSSFEKQRYLILVIL